MKMVLNSRKRVKDSCDKETFFPSEAHINQCRKKRALQKYANYQGQDQFAHLWKYERCFTLCILIYLRNEFDFWKIHGIMNTSGLVHTKWSPKGFTLTLQETRSIHDFLNLPNIEFITYIYILYYQSSNNFQFSPNLAGFSDI